MTSRRAWIVGGVAGVAALAGAGAALWQRGKVGDSDDGGLWAMRFARPEGGELVMSELQGKPLVLNFWASWCAPCVKEMPALDRFARDFAAQGWQVVGLAIDGPTPVREFLHRVPVSFAIGLAGVDGAELARRLGNERGLLPFTVVMGPDGRPLKRKLGETTYEQLASWVKAT
jgi:thiol-disulfide isomerase/thioredoxin